MLNKFMSSSIKNIRRASTDTGIGNVITVRVENNSIITEYVNVYTGETSSDPKGVPLISKEDFLCFKNKTDMPIAFVRNVEI